MPLLTLILIAPAGAGLANLLVVPRRAMRWLNVLAFVATLGLGIALLGRVLAHGVVSEWNEFLYADALSAWMVLLITMVSLSASLYAGRYFERDLANGAVTPGRVREFFVLTPLFSTGMFLVVLANNLGVMWAAVEATALASVLLVALYNRKTSLEAAWKYIMLGSLGLALALLGTVFVYAAACKNNSGPLPSFNWSHLVTVADQFDPCMMKIAFLLALVGYGTKAGLAPMHTWLPDAHSEAPSPTSAMLSGVSLKVAIYALLRFHILTSACLGSGFSRHLLLGFGLASMFLARAVHSRAAQPQADARLFQPRTRRPHLHWHRHEHARHHFWRVAAHGLSLADKTGFVFRSGKHRSCFSFAPISASSGMAW